jgi:hypothetical protein
MLEEYKQLLLGTFNNRTQAFSYPAQYSQITLRHVLLDNGMIYGEQRYTVRKEPPYRQFVLNPYESDDGRIIVKNYKLKDTSKHLNFNNLDQLTESELIENIGCNHVVVEVGDTFYGIIEGCNCMIVKNGRNSFLYNVSQLSENKYKVLDRGYCPETRELVWGSEHGMFEFDRA